NIYLLYFLNIHRSPRSTLFPYTTLFRSEEEEEEEEEEEKKRRSLSLSLSLCLSTLKFRANNSKTKIPRWSSESEVTCMCVCNKPDRKSTRLNSSHDQISYAVFCLKKKII